MWRNSYIKETNPGAQCRDLHLNPEVGHSSKGFIYTADNLSPRFPEFIFRDERCTVNSGQSSWGPVLTAEKPDRCGFNHKMAEADFCFKGQNACPSFEAGKKFTWENGRVFPLQTKCLVFIARTKDTGFQKRGYIHFVLLLPSASRARTTPWRSPHHNKSHETSCFFTRVRTKMRKLRRS